MTDPDDATTPDGDDATSADDAAETTDDGATSADDPSGDTANEPDATTDVEAVGTEDANTEDAADGAATAEEVDGDEPDRLEDAETDGGDDEPAAEAITAEAGDDEPVTSDGDADTGTDDAVDGAADEADAVAASANEASADASDDGGDAEPAATDDAEIADDAPTAEQDTASTEDESSEVEAVAEPEHAVSDDAPEASVAAPAVEPAEAAASDTSADDEPGTDDGAATPDEKDDTPILPAGKKIAAADPSAKLVTGILAAESRARTETDRRRRNLVGGGVLGLLIVAVIVIMMTVSQANANRQAREQASINAANASLAMSVIEMAEEQEPLAARITTDAERLRVSLEEHLVLTDREDDEIAADAASALAQLREDAELLAAAAARENPTLDPLIPRDIAITVLQQLETLRAESSELAAETAASADRAETWLAAVEGVTQALTDHVAVVEAEEETSDPDELIDLWTAERPTLEALATQARQAQAVEGLQAWGLAHLEYAEANLAWIDEIIPLLEEVDVEAYNQRFTSTFDVSDPFGFSAAVTAATQQALDGPLLIDLGTVGARATLVVDAVTTLEQTVADELASRQQAG